MLTLSTTDEKQSSCFNLLGTDSKPKHTNLITTNTSLLSNNCESGMDTCSFYNGPSDAAIVAFCESNSGSSNFDVCGSLAYSGGETCGSIASSSGTSSVSSFSGSSSSCGGSSSFC